MSGRIFSTANNMQRIARMATEDSVSLKTLPNLRKVDIKGKIYRSSRQDLISLEDNVKLESFDFKTVMDFRSPNDYRTANGQKLYDFGTELREIKIPRNKLGRNDPVIWPMVWKPLTDINTGPVTKPRKRYFINFFKLNYIGAVFKRATVIQRCISVFYLLIDVIFKTHFFVQYFAKKILNPAGLISNYIDMLELSCKQIYTVLKLLSHDEYLPALVNCSHGKDRTGLVCALVLHVIGKPVDYIADDYAASEEGLSSIKDRTYSEIVDQFHMDESFTHAKKETMERVFEYLIETYGSVDNYLESIGFGKEDQERMRKVLLEE